MAFKSGDYHHLGQVLQELLADQALRRRLEYGVANVGYKILPESTKYILAVFEYFFFEQMKSLVKYGTFDKN